jgi:hypothetical protein
LSSEIKIDYQNQMSGLRRFSIQQVRKDPYRQTAVYMLGLQSPVFIAFGTTGRETTSDLLQLRDEDARVYAGQGFYPLQMRRVPGMQNIYKN